MTTALVVEDIRDFLAGFAAAIELDQLRVDALDPENFHPGYDDNMWRSSRRDHLAYIRKLLTTLNTIPSAMLSDLTWTAMSCEPAVVGQVVVELFAEAASGSNAQGELETAALFFGSLIKGVSGRSEAD